MKPSKQQILKAEAVHFMLIEAEKEKNVGGNVVFITADLFENFIKNIHYSQKIKSLIACFGVDINNVPIKVGLSGMLNKIEFQIISGTNKMYGGTKLPLDVVIQALEKFEDKEE